MGNITTNIVKEVFADASEVAGFEFQFGTPSEVNKQMSGLGAVNKKRFPVLMLFNGYSETCGRFFLTVDNIEVIIAEQCKIDIKSDDADAKFNELSVRFQAFLEALALDKRISGTAAERFEHTRVRRMYQNVGGTPAVAWVITFNSNNFKNICTNDRF